jgi:glycosyltransferase involved in cell wall biosynthesis
MPVVEAGIAGVPVVASSAVPAALEIADRGMLVFNPGMPAEVLARRIIRLVRRNPICRYRRRIRMEYSWQAIFRASMEPLVLGKEQS